MLAPRSDSDRNCSGYRPPAGSRPSHVAEAREAKTVRSYRLVFRRRWRIFRIGNWRIPLPGGLELRLIGYWLGALAPISELRRRPLRGLPIAAMPPALRLLAIPLLAAWALCRWELDG